MKKAKLFKVTVILLVIIAGLHFVPVYSRIGYLKDSPANLCIAYPKPLDDHYRLILNWINGFNQDRRGLTQGQGLSCAPWVHLRLYLL